MTPDITVVIVSWNVAEVLRDCLDSLARFKGGLDLEVFVVDNASSDNTLEMLRTGFPWVRVIANQENFGFARANNQAIRQAQGRFVLLLNPDTRVEEGALQMLFDFLATHPAAGAVGPGLQRIDGNPDSNSARVSYSLAAALLIDALRLRAVPVIGPYLYRRLVTPYDYRRTQRVEAISGAAILARREVLEALDGFGEMYLHCGEDLDLCFRIGKAGWEIWYFPQAVIIHLYGQSTRQAVLRTFVNVAISNEMFFTRCYGRLRGRLYRWIVKTVQIPVLIATGVVRFVLGRASAAEVYQRLQIAWAVMLWRPMT
jgi:GT2 family glycosyltransferase